MEQLDGNAAGGVLHAIFPFEMTTVKGVCAGCGERRVMGAVAVYKTGMGTILRCPTCTVLIGVAEIEGHYWLDMRACACLGSSVEHDAALLPRASVPARTMRHHPA